MIVPRSAWSATLGTCLMLAGCAGARGAPRALAPLPTALSGAYDVQGNVSNESVTALVTFSDDRTYRVDSNHGSCDNRFNNLVKGPKITVGCPGLRITFSLAGSEFFSYADVSLTIVENVPDGQVCRRYETNPTTGQRTCVEMVPRYVQRSVTRKGSLQVRKAR